MNNHSSLTIQPDISIIIVSWRVRDLLQTAIQSVLDSLEKSRQAGYQFKVEIIVIDNASNDGTAAMVRSLFPAVRIIANATNRGFGAANNQGLAIARGRYIMMLNPDTFINNEAIRQMYEFMEEQPYVGLIGPRLENFDGGLQRSCRRFPSFWSTAMILLKLHHLFPISLPIRRYYMLAFQHKTLRQVDQVMGACMFVRRDALDRVGNFDEQFYLWFEEVDLCKRIYNAGYIIFFYPWARVGHRRSSSFVQQQPLWRQWYFAQSCRRYFWKHHHILSAGLISILSFVSLIPALLVSLMLAFGWRLQKNPKLKGQ